MKKGDIFRALLEPRSGSEQRGRRPVILVSHDGFNQVQSWRTVIVVPLSTSPRQGRRYPTVVEIPAGEAGLPVTSYALCHQVTTVDRGKLLEPLGTLPDSTLQAVERGLRVALGMG